MRHVPYIFVELPEVPIAIVPRPQQLQLPLRRRGLHASGRPAPAAAWFALMRRLVDQAPDPRRFDGD